MNGAMTTPSWSASFPREKDGQRKYRVFLSAFPFLCLLLNRAWLIYSYCRAIYFSVKERIDFSWNAMIQNSGPEAGTIKSSQCAWLPTAHTCNTVPGLALKILCPTSPPGDCCTAVAGPVVPVLTVAGPVVPRQATTNCMVSLAGSRRQSVCRKREWLVIRQTSQMIQGKKHT